MVICPVKGLGGLHGLHALFLAGVWAVRAGGLFPMEWRVVSPYFETADDRWISDAATHRLQEIEW